MKNKRILTGARFRGISCRRGIFAKIVQNEAIFSLVSDCKKKKKKKINIYTENCCPSPFALPGKIANYDDIKSKNLCKKRPK